MEIKDKIELLKTEYFKLQDYYESFDTKVQTIRGWSATVSIGAISAGFAYKNEYIWVFAALTALVFWIMDAKWKIFQYCYSQRITEIEKAFREDNFENIVPIQIYSSWFRSWESGNYKLRNVLFMFIVTIPYLYTIIICILLFFLKNHYKNLFWQF